MEGGFGSIMSGTERSWNHASSTFGFGPRLNLIGVVGAGVRLRLRLWRDAGRMGAEDSDTDGLGRMGADEEDGPASKAAAWAG